ncbi:MAG: hypothetical protein HZY77_16310 [Thiobacillus sp.]|uniref:hypothetical protein n=1 Tax=Thiobacillus sp. TaxID=924 RepID=UPI00168C850C|nr:hypothetical protein [Thiobacillus sp.]QLQ04098.1 MAG: hypothetical protein HZY77_16310 [Thiobacillus sp.]
MNKPTPFSIATAHYFKAVGAAALQPSASLSSTTPNGTTYLRNANGLLAVVTSTGKVFDRVAGTRLDGGVGSDSNDCEPDPFDFGAAAMATALSMREEDFREAYRRGEIVPPDAVRFGGPRWSRQSLRDELSKKYPVDITGALAGLDALNAINRGIERAESMERLERARRRGLS